MKKRIKLGAAVMIFGFLTNLFSCNGADKVDLPALVSNGALVIDVRTPGEFASGAIEGASNIPYDQIAGRIGGVEPDTNRVIIVYCRSGARSGVARRRLKKIGYTQVIDAGGFSKVRKILNK